MRFAVLNAITMLRLMWAILRYLSYVPEWMYLCNDPTIGSYNNYHLRPNGVPRGNQRWYGLVYFIQIAGKPRIRPRG